MNSFHGMDRNRKEGIQVSTFKNDICLASRARLSFIVTDIMSAGKSRWKVVIHEIAKTT